MENLKIEKEFIYNKINERMFKISGRRKLIKKPYVQRLDQIKF